MKLRPRIVTVMCLLAVAGGWLFWPHGRQNTAGPQSRGAAASTNAARNSAVAGVKGGAATPSFNTNKLAFRLSNTTNSIRQLQNQPHAILLANAFIDTDQRLNLKIPAHLRSVGDPGAYIVQARGLMDARFRALLASAGAQIVSYIPNNAYLVNLPASVAGQLSGNSLVQAVLPYEPYYKLQSSLLGLAVKEQPLPPGTALTLGLFAADATTAEAAIQALGAKIIGRDQSPFGPMLRVLAPADWTTLVQSPVVQFAEPAFARRPANDLSRIRVGISSNTITSQDYLNLQGANVLVAVNDSGVDETHPDLTGRVSGLQTNDLVDTAGHGTFVAGIIASSGVNSHSPVNVGKFAEGSTNNADFRGKAPLASLFSLNYANYTDYQLQTNAAMIGALICNNSWDNGDPAYDLAAASYDFATRDALPGTPGSQPVLFVFAAGNSGGGDDHGQEGSGDTILSPGTAKNVITVGALEQPRYITNIVINADGTSNQYWLPGTDSSNQVAAYSSRGNVGIGTEGSYGRFKPDLVSPGTFVVSTRSSQLDLNAFYSVTNDVGTYYADQTVDTNSFAYFSVSVPDNTLSVQITILPHQSSQPFPQNMPIYCQQSGYPDPVGAPGSIDFTTANDMASIPPGGGNCTLASLQGNGFDFAVGNPTNVTVNFDVSVVVLVTNSVGDLEVVLEGMNDQLGPYYMYQSGTSMAAADVSGVLALIQDYFTNTLQLAPSPALMKAVMINGSRSVSGYVLSVTNGINFQGWGLDNIQDCVPANGLFNQSDGSTAGSSFFVDQSPANALATGDRHTYFVNVATNLGAKSYQLKATLVWTDPPGDPAAAIKLVNGLELVITNLATGDVFFGNDIQASVQYNLPAPTNAPPNIDTVNNVQNIILTPPLAGSYSVTVLGRAVNVNALTAQTNNAAGQFAPNIVQDYALVVSVGEGEIPHAFTVTDKGVVSNPTGDLNLTVVNTTNAPLANQMAGASSPLLGTNTLPLGTNTIWGTNGVLTIGQTNQWHFYVVTNTGLSAAYQYAAFLTFNVNTLSLPRMGVYASSIGNATKPEANLDLFATDDSSITNLNPVAISKCLAGAGNSRAALANAGTQFVFYTNSAPGQVYYVGVQSEDQMAAEYDFLPVFTDTPFGGLDNNGNEIVNGIPLPMPIPTGDNAHPGLANPVIALATLPMVVEKVTVTNLDEHQDFGGLVGVLKFGGQGAILNNHDGFGDTFGAAPIVYDDTAAADRPLGTTNTDGPGSLLDFRATSALGPWILSVLDDSASGFTGQVSQLTLVIQPHRDLAKSGTIVSIPPGGWFIDWVDVPAGYTNLTFYATNYPPLASPALQMYEKFGSDPTLTDYDQEAGLTNGNPPGNSISIGPPLAMGRYFIGIYNPSSSTVSAFVLATLGINSSVNDIFAYSASSGQVLLDDAVTPVSGPDPSQPANSANATNGSYISVPNPVTNLISSVNVGLVVNSPRISDYAFTLVSPGGQRILLMENRGGSDPNGAGLVFVYTNVLNTTATGGAAANTNYLAVDPAGGSVPIIYNFYTVPDQMTVYDTTNPADFDPNSPSFCILNTGFIHNPPGGGGGPQGTLNEPTNAAYLPGTTMITIIMNQFGNPYASGGDQWWYSAGAANTNFEYLEFTDDTNLASVPIKFAPPPFSFTVLSSNYTLSDLDLATNGDYHAPATIADANGGWSVPASLVTVSTVVATNGQPVLVTNTVARTNNFVSVVNDASTALGGDIGHSNYLALAYGAITRSIPTVPGRMYNVTFWYRGPGIAGWWRGEGNANDSSSPENNDNNGALIGLFNFPAGEVDQAFEFLDPGNPYEFVGTNSYVQVPASSSLNVGGFTVEGWINPTNLAQPQPLVEWLARVPTNAATADTNLAFIQGPVLDRATGNYYYLLAATNWQTSESWAEEMGGHLVTMTTANLENWVYDTFTAYGTEDRDLWIGLGYTNTTGTFGWTSGYANLPYTNWAPGLPFPPTNPNDTFVAIMGPTNAYPGLWKLVGDDRQINAQPPTLPIYGVVEVTALPANGVQFWISGTNGTPGGTNTLPGCLCANIVDTNYVSHPIWSAPGLLASNVYQHVALTFNTNTGVAALYLNGTNVATSNLYSNGVAFVPKTDGDLLLGWDMSRSTNNYYAGEMDEISLYGRALSDAEISGIYQVSANTTNRTIGKFDPTVTPAAGLAEAVVTFGGVSNVIFGVNNQWLMNSYTFTATATNQPLTIAGIAPGILLDDFSVSEAPLTNLYYFPEQPLAALAGSAPAGDWTLQVWDSRVGAFVTNLDQLVNWQLSFVLVSNAVIALSLPPQTPVTSTVPPGQTVYYSVTVPAWAQDATNILVSSSLPVSLQYFQPTNYPGYGNPPDATPLVGQTSGVGPILTPNSAPPLSPLVPGSTYYLGVQNNNAQSATVVLQVNYDILTLTNSAPFSDVLTTNGTADYSSARYFAFDVGSNACEATFQLLQLSGNADLVVSKGAPLPALNRDNYGSFNNGNVDENIYVLTNSAPVPLSAGVWYLGVLNRDGTPIQYSVLAKELDVTNLPAIINLTNGVPFNWTAGPGAALTNFFHFQATNVVVNGTNVPLPGLRFELYGLSGNGDLTLQSNALPLAPPFFQTSQHAGAAPEQILLFTNRALPSLAADWYLGVPNHEVTNISYTIVVGILTNSYFPAFPGAQGAQGAGGGAVGAGHAGQTNSTVYHVTTTADSGPGSLRDAVGSANQTVVFDLGGAINLASPLIITNSNLTIAGQTAPSGGITVAGNMTTVTNVHDVIIRDVRFRCGAADDSFQFVNVSNVIADHISAEWTADNLVSVLNGANVTVQWSVMADSLATTNASATNGPTGSLLRQGGGALSFHHNLYADNVTGSPRLGDNLTLDFVNNVIYNWGLFSGLSDGTNDLTNVSTNGCTNQLNYVCNYLIAGPDTAPSVTNIAFFGGVTNVLSATWIFQTNNFIDSDVNGVLNGADTGLAMFANDYTPFSHAFATPPVSVDEAYQAYEKVLDFAGVNFALRDYVDTNIVAKVRYQTSGIISAVPTLTVPGIVAWWKGEDNALDSVGTNNGVWDGQPQYATGEVGQAFYFTGSPHADVHVLASPSLNVGATNTGFTLEAWVNPDSGTLVNGQSIFQWSTNSGPGPIGVYLEIKFFSSGALHFDVVDATGADHDVVSPAGTLLGDTWQHVAATYDPTIGTAMIYCDGAVVASTNVGTGFTPQTATDFYLGAQPAGTNFNDPNYFTGYMDEATIYNRVLSPAEIQAIYQAGSLGKSLTAYGSLSLLPYLDTDQDGLPDFWESTFTPANLYIPSNNNDRDGDGYTDLEEYNNWLAGPHALTTVTNPVAVDLYQMFGASGHLAFFVTNGVQGFVYLTNVLGSVTNPGTTWSNTVAVFTPTNGNYYGYAAFDCCVTNLDTAAYFGPVTVSVIVSAAPIVLNSNMPPVINFLNSGVPSDPTNYGGSDFYGIVVKTNDLGALFEVDNPTGPMAIVLSDHLPLPSLSSYVYYTNQPPSPATLQIAVLTNSLPVPLHAGTWYMAAVNESGSNVVYTAKISLLTTLMPPEFIYPTNTTVTNIIETVPWGVSCVATDLDTPPLPLSFALVSGPPGLGVTNGVISWTPTEAQGDTNYQVAVSVSNGAFAVTNTFTINVLVSNLPPVAPTIPNQLVIVPGGQLLVTNTFINPNKPAYPLTYTLTTTLSLADTNQPAIGLTNGIITWTPTNAEANATYLFTTVATDTNPPAINSKSLSATNSFYVTVLSALPPGQPETNIVAPGGINWYAVLVPTNAIFATNTLLFATLPVNLWYSTNLPPSITNAAVELLANVTNGVSVLCANLATAPTNLVPGGIYFLGVQNTNSAPVTNALRVDFAYAPPPPPSPLPPGQPGTNVVAANGLNWFEVDVPANALQASNFLLFATAPLNLWYSTNQPPSITNAADAELLTNQTSGLAVLNAASAPALTPGGIYYLGVQNTNNFAVTNAVEVTFQFIPKFSIFSIVPTNDAAGSNGFLLTWFAPTNLQFHLQWTRSLVPLNWTNFNGVISGVPAATNALFQYFDDGSQSGPVGVSRFYRLLLLNSPSNTAPFFLLNAPGTFDASPSSPFGYPNTARDWDLPPQILTYAVTNSLGAPNVTINPLSGVIAWTPTLAQLGVSNVITTVVTDNGVPPKSATNSLVVLVPPNFGSISVAANGVTFQWMAPASEKFQIRWTTNLVPVNWHVFPNTITSTNGNFIFVDTNQPLWLMEFYQLILLP